MKKKVLSFVVRGGKFLALYCAPHPEHWEKEWFVVTGGVEGDESYEEAARREILEETGLKVREIVGLNWGSIYDWGGECFEEHNFISFVDAGDVVLSEEHVKYEWFELDEFIEKVGWASDKGVLRKVLVKALNKEKYFDEFVFKDYR